MKVFILVLVFFSFAFSSYEKVKIGKIDSYYHDKITKTELINIIKEIEDIFESQLGFNVFDYSNNGKPIDLLYMPPSQKKYRFNESIKQSQYKKQRLSSLQESIVRKQETLQVSQEKIQNEYELLNKDITRFNNYVREAQAQEITSRSEYEQIKKEINSKKRKLARKKDLFEQRKTKYNSSVKSYNQLTSQYNTLVKQFNRLQRKIEVLSRSIKEVKGAAKGYTQTTLETYVKNGRKYTTKKEKNYMEKIEIYGFDNLAQLKTVLAHEIAHLVGVGHINVKGALMNPVLQENQMKDLWLTPEDIKAFRRSF